MSLRPAARLLEIERTRIRRIFDAAPPDAINLGLGQPDLPTPAALRLGGIEAIAQGSTGYTGTAGDPQLRAAVARRYRGVVDGPEGVLITVGSQEALYLAHLVLVDPGQEVLHPDPGYPSYPSVARLVGARPVAYPLEPASGFRLSAASVLDRLTAQTGLVVLSSPSNPVGTCHPREELERLVRELGRRGIPWLSDEVYRELTYVGRSPSPAEFAPEGGMVASGLSKELAMTGWRVGWLIGPAPVVERAAAAHQHLVTCAPAVSQLAARVAFTPRGRAAGRAWIARLRLRRELMARELARLPGLRFEPPEGAFFFFVDVSSRGDAETIARRALERGRVITIPGGAFGKAGAGHLRLSFAAGKSAIERGVRALGDSLES